MCIGGQTGYIGRFLQNPGLWSEGLGLAAGVSVLQLLWGTWAWATGVWRHLCRQKSLAPRLGKLDSDHLKDWKFQFQLFYFFLLLLSLLMEISFKYICSSPKFF